MKDDELQSILNYLLTMHEVGRHWPLGGSAAQRKVPGLDAQRRAAAFVGSDIFSLLLLHMCQLAVQTEVVLFTVE